MSFVNLTAKFKDTKSTCGAATCTVTSVHGGALRNWSKDKLSEAHRMLLRKAVPRCRVCDDTMVEPTVCDSEKDKFRRGEPATCDSCYEVSLFSNWELVSVMRSVLAWFFFVQLMFSPRK